MSHNVDKTGPNEEDWNHHCADQNDSWSCEDPEDHKQADNDRVQVVTLEAAAERLEETVAAVIAVNLWTGAALLDSRHMKQRMMRTIKNAPSGTAITTAMMAMKAGDPTNSEPEDPGAAEPLWEDEQIESH